MRRKLHSLGAPYFCPQGAEVTLGRRVAQPGQNSCRSCCLRPLWRGRRRSGGGLRAQAAGALSRPCPSELVMARWQPVSPALVIEGRLATLGGATGQCPPRYLPCTCALRNMAHPHTGHSCQAHWVFIPQQVRACCWWRFWGTRGRGLPAEEDSRTHARLPSCPKQLLSILGSWDP